MTKEEFGALVGRLEAQAKANPAGYRIQVLMMALLGNAYLAAGLTGLGVLYLPEYMAKAHPGELVRLFDGWRFAPMPLFVAFPPNRNVSRKLRVFIDWIAELMAEHAPLGAR